MKQITVQQITQYADFRNENYEVGHTECGQYYWRELSSPVIHYTRDINVIESKMGVFNV